MEAMLNEWLWQEKFWLPSNARWKDIQMNEEEGRFPLPRDLLYTLPLAFAFIALRYVFERWDTPAPITAWPWHQRCEIYFFAVVISHDTFCEFSVLQYHIIKSTKDWINNWLSHYSEIFWHLYGYQMTQTICPNTPVD